MPCIPTPALTLRVLQSHNLRVERTTIHMPTMMALECIGRDDTRRKRLECGPMAALGGAEGRRIFTQTGANCIRSRRSRMPTADENSSSATGAARCRRSSEWTIGTGSCVLGKKKTIHPRPSVRKKGCLPLGECSIRDNCYLLGLRWFGGFDFE